MAFSTGSFAELPFSTVGGTFATPTIVESATGSDSVARRGLWEPVDDTQNANWVQVTVNPGTGWTIIPTV
jgi:hypothetical protein